MNRADKHACDFRERVENLKKDFKKFSGAAITIADIVSAFKIMGFLGEPSEFEIECLEEKIMAHKRSLQKLKKYSG